MRAILALTLPLALAASCGKKKETPPAAPAAGSAAPAGAAAGAARAPAGQPPTPYAGPRQPRVLRRLAPITVDEVRALLPAPGATREVRPLAKARVGERVEVAWCFDAGSLDTLGAQVAEQYAAAGWTQLAVKPNPSTPDRMTISASKAPYALFGSLQRGRWAECDGTKGQTYLQLGVHHVEAVEPLAAPGPASVGTTGTTDLRAPAAPVKLEPRKPSAAP